MLKQFTRASISLPTEHQRALEARLKVPVHSRSNWNFEVLVFVGRGNTGEPGEKPFGARTRTNNKLNPRMTPSTGIEPGQIREFKKLLRQQQRKRHKQ